MAKIGASAMRLAAMKTLQHLETSRGWARVTLQEGELHPGDTPVQADYEAHHKFSSVINNHVASAQLSIDDIVGEEKILKAPPTVPPGHRLIVLDPLDGSTQWMMIRTGHCVSALMLLADETGRLRVESAVVVNPVHAFTLVNNVLTMGPTNGTSDDDIVLTSCLPDTLGEPSLAITGFKSKDRGSFRALLAELDGWGFLSIGGNPVTPYVIAGSLSACVTWRPQYTWDAVGILMATYTDAVVGNLDGDRVTGPAFATAFNDIVMTQDARVIPPMIVAKDLERFEAVVAAMERARDRFGHRFGSGMEDELI